jgi:hypothetical protein
MPGEQPPPRNEEIVNLSALAAVALLLRAAAAVRNSSRCFAAQLSTVGGVSFAATARVHAAVKRPLHPPRFLQSRALVSALKCFNFSQPMQARCMRATQVNSRQTSTCRETHEYSAQTKEHHI